ncbi:DNA-binding response regulator [Streptomyces sp. SID8358]|uniref:response regulator transcription factor n=1 Tax=Streptomyces sp. SID8358 TaxID=2690342 RepID=UPI000DACCB07|nr:response regulator transcription factor [Streptomyces sp. SID8358]MYU35336.1 DNA-binding response regulator [Streptomyces sp. SID8358]
MHRVLLAGGPALVRDAYAHVIVASPAFVLQGQTATLTEALTALTPTTCDLLLIEARELARVPWAAAQVSLRLAAARTRTAVLGTISPAGLPLLTEAGVTGVFGPCLEPDAFFTALDAVCRGAMVIAPAPSRTPPAPAAHGSLSPLTQREREVLALVATQPDNTAIALALGVSPLTVKSHINRVMRKLAVSSRAQLVTLAYESRLIVPGARTTSGAAPSDHGAHPADVRPDHPCPVPDNCGQGEVLTCGAYG